MMLLALALLLLQAVPAYPPGKTLRIGPGEEHPSLAAAIAAAAAGDTLRLAPGVYEGPFTVDRPLTLVGGPGVVLDGAGAGTTLTVAADSVTVAGLTVRNSGRSLNDDQAAIKLVRCAGCRVVDTRIERSLHGIYLVESAGVELRGNVIHGDTTLPEPRRGNGIHLFHSVGTLLEGNRIEQTRDGIYFSFSSHSRVRENEVRDVRYGLHYMYSDDNRFTRNRFTRNAAGAAIMFSNRIHLEENTFSEHVGYRAYGILLQTSTRIEAVRNRIEGNLVGLFLDMSSENVFRENLIAGNGIGIDLIASAEGNTFAGNSIVDNRTAVRKPNGAGQNSWAVDGEGNYWGDRAVYDLDADGIGDRPYQASDPFAVQAARRPVLEVFGGTPAAFALSWAERAFPVFGLPRVEDSAPLVRPRAATPVAQPPAAEGGVRTAASLGAIALPLLLIGGAARLRYRRIPRP